METLSFSSKKKEELINITSEVRDAISKSRVHEGICSIFVPHATAGLFINEDEPGLKEDLLNSLSFMVPNQLPREGRIEGSNKGFASGYRHDQLDGNATSHIKATLVGPSLTLTIHEGKPVLGTWQQIFLCEFDGPRNTRKVTLQVVGS